MIIESRKESMKLGDKPQLKTLLNDGFNPTMLKFFTKGNCFLHQKSRSTACIYEDYIKKLVQNKDILLDGLGHFTKNHLTYNHLTDNHFIDRIV